MPYITLSGVLISQQRHCERSLGRKGQVDTVGPVTCIGRLRVHACVRMHRPAECKSCFITELLLGSNRWRSILQIRRLSRPTKRFLKPIALFAQRLSGRYALQPGEILEREFAFVCVSGLDRRQGEIMSV